MNSWTWGSKARTPQHSPLLSRRKTNTPFELNLLQGGAASREAPLGAWQSAGPRAFRQTGHIRDGAIRRAGGAGDECCRGGWREGRRVDPSARWYDGANSSGRSKRQTGWRSTWLFISALLRSSPSVFLCLPGPPRASVNLWLPPSCLFVFAVKCRRLPSLAVLDMWKPLHLFWLKTLWVLHPGTASVACHMECFLKLVWNVG